jgi:hypothetical protein
MPADESALHDSGGKYLFRADVLLDLEDRGIINIWTPAAVEAALSSGPKKLAKQTTDVKAAMIKNSEILIEGQIPPGSLEQVN